MVGQHNKYNIADNFPRFKRYLVFRRFVKKVNFGSYDEDECWLWKGSLCGMYGQFYWPEKSYRMSAHVAAYLLFVGKIPKRHSKKRLCVCHDCPNGDNPLCVNPNHLWLGTHKENTQDMIRKGRSKQFKLTPDNVREIYKLYATGKYTKTRLGKKFGVSHTTVGSIVNKHETYKGVIQ